MSLLNNLFDFMLDRDGASQASDNDVKSNGKQLVQPTPMQSQVLGFKEFIESELKKRASIDSQFAKSFSKQNKSIDECVKYIIGEMYKKCVRSGNYGYAVNDCADNSDLVSMAIHYFDEDDIEITTFGGGVKASKVHSNDKPKQAPVVPIKNNTKKAESGKKEMSIFDFSFD